MDAIDVVDIANLILGPYDDESLVVCLKYCTVTLEDQEVESLKTSEA